MLPPLELVTTYVVFRIFIGGLYHELARVPFVTGYPGCNEVINAFASHLSKINDNAKVIWSYGDMNTGGGGFIQAGNYEGNPDLLNQVMGMPDPNISPDDEGCLSSIEEGDSDCPF